MASKQNKYIQQMRKEYPEYSHVNDTDLAKAYREKHYASRDEDEFMDTIGLHQKTIVEKAKDTWNSHSIFESPTAAEMEKAKHPVFPVADISKPLNEFAPKPPVNAITVPTMQSDDVVATRSFKPAAQTEQEKFDNVPVRMLSPTQQDEEVNAQNAKTFSTQIELSDVGNTLGKGAASIYKGAGWALEHAGDAIGSDGLAAYGKAVRDTGAEAAKYWDDGLTPEAIKARNVQLTARDTNGDISVLDTLTNIANNPATVGLMATESVPASALGMGVGGMIAKGFALIPSIGEKLASAIGYGLGEGITAAPMQGVGTEEKVMGMKDEDLLLHPEYRAMLAKLGDKDAAKLAVAKAAGGDAAMYTMVSTTLLSAPFGYVMAPLFAGAGKEASQLFRQGVAKESLITGAEELGQEVMQSGAEQVGSNYALRDHANVNQKLSDGVAESMVAGGVSGFGMGAGMGAGQTVMNNRAIDTHEAKMEALADSYRQDAYNKQMMGSALELKASQAPVDVFAQEVDAKIKTIQASLTNLAINHPEHIIPQEAYTTPAVAEQIIQKATDKGLNLSDNDGMNAIDVGFTKVAEEMGVDLTPVIETQAPTISETITPVAQSITAPVQEIDPADAARLKELDAKPEDELTVDEQWELGDLITKIEGGVAGNDTNVATNNVAVVQDSLTTEQIWDGMDYATKANILYESGAVKNKKNAAIIAEDFYKSLNNETKSTIQLYYEQSKPTEENFTGENVDGVVKENLIGEVTDMNVGDNLYSVAGVIAKNGYTSNGNVSISSRDAKEQSYVHVANAINYKNRGEDQALIEYQLFHALDNANYTKDERAKFDDSKVLAALPSDQMEEAFNKIVKRPTNDTLTPDVWATMSETDRTRLAIQAGYSDKDAVVVSAQNYTDPLDPNLEILSGVYAKDIANATKEFDPNSYEAISAKIYSWEKPADNKEAFAKAREDFGLADMAKDKDAPLSQRKLADQLYRKFHGGEFWDNHYQTLEDTYKILENPERIKVTEIDRSVSGTQRAKIIKENFAGQWAMVDGKPVMIELDASRGSRSSGAESVKVYYENGYSESVGVGQIKEYKEAIEVTAKPNAPRELNSRAQAIQDAGDIPIGGSEDEKDAAVVRLMNQKDMDSEYKKLSGKGRTALEDQHDISRGSSIDPIHYTRAYDFLPTQKKQSAGVQNGFEFEGTQNALFDTTASEEYVTPAWAKDLVSSTTRYEDIITAVTNAKNGEYSVLATRVMDALEKAGSPHLEKELERYDELASKFWDTGLNDMEDQEFNALAELLTTILQEQENGTNIGGTTSTQQESTGGNGSQQGSDTPQQESIGEGTHTGGSQTNDIQPVPQSKPAQIVFDTKKVYSTKGVMHETPSVLIAKTIQKDVAKYVQQLAKALGGWTVGVDKKGKTLPFMGVSADLAPAGGDMGIKLFKPNSNVGIYISLRYEQTEDASGNRAYVMGDHTGLGQMFRTIKGQTDYTGGHNNWVKSSELTSQKFVSDIMEMVDREATKVEAKIEETKDANINSGTKEPISEQLQGNAGTESKLLGTKENGEGEKPSAVSTIQSNGDAGGDAGVSSTGVQPDRSTGDGDKRPSANGRVDTQNQYTLTQDDVYASGEVGRFVANIDAIKLLKQNKQHYTKEEKLTLSKYTGFGGLGKAFRDLNGQAVEGWSERVRLLEGLLTADELKNVKSGQLDAYYTPIKIAQSMWDISAHLGFKGGTVLEPSMGVGRFVGLLPQNLKGKVAFNGIEIDPTTYKIAAALYGNINARNMGFEETNYDSAHDMVIGNPPYGEFKLYDKNKKEYNSLSAHNYFVVKSLDALKEGGVLNFVISSSFLDNLDAKTIKLIHEKADFVGAIRLPSDAFKETGTKVTTDIVIFQKKIGSNFVNPKTWSTKGTLNGFKINQYFIDNPKMLLGDWVKGYRGGELKANGDFDTKLSEAIASLPKDILNSDGAIQENKKSHAHRPSVMYVEGESVFVNIKDGEGVTQKKINLTPAKAKQFIALRDELLVLVNMQLDTTLGDKEVEAQRTKVNALYDGWVKKNGALNKTLTRSAITKDKDGFLVATLEENYKGEIKADNKSGKDPRVESWEKADILTTRTIRPYTDIKATNAKEALEFAINQKGNVDLEYMAQISDKSQEEIMDELLGDIFYDGDAGWVTKDEFLSGDVKTKLQNATDDFHKEALLKVIPKDLEAQEIRVEIGQSWIDAKYIAKFMGEELGYRNQKAHQSSATAKWFIGGSSYNFPFTASGVENNAILDSALNNKIVRVTFKDKSGKTYLDEERTDFANSQVQMLKEKFEGWVFADATRRDELVAHYNETKNRFVEKNVEDIIEKYSIPNIKHFSPRVHQTRAVYKTVFGASPMLLNHTVGSGKTLTSQMIAMEWRRLGKAKKPLIVTLKSVVPQYVREFRMAYPNAKILLPNDSDFSTANRKMLLSSIATGDYDAVVLSHEQLSALQNPLELQNELVLDEIENLEAALREVLNSDLDYKEKGRSKRQIELAIEKLETNLAKLQDASKDDVLGFDKLGIDGIIVDEAHYFKKLVYSTSMGSIKGMPDTSGSKRAFDLYVKTQYLLRSNPHKTVVFMTGTPITNTLPELYLLQKYLQADELKSQGIYHFDAWAKDYTEQTTEIELTSTGGLKEVTRLKEFKNLPTLIQTTRQFVDTVTNNDIKKSDVNFKLPPLKNGKVTEVYAQPSEEQVKFNLELIKRIEAFGKDNPDNHLAVFGDGAKMAIDMRLISSSFQDTPNSKVNLAVAKVFEKYQEFDSVKGTQLIFSDKGVPKGKDTKAKLEELIRQADEGNEEAQKALNEYNDEEIDDVLNGSFSVYSDMKSKLVKMGIPENEVVFIHDFDTKEKKEKLSELVNSGAIRIVIGSTKKLGTGMNVQKRLTAVHHIDIPFTPAELEQRNGRIIRQGNELLKTIDGFEVEIVHYLTKRTLDAMNFQILQNKAKFIEQFYNGSMDGDVDIDEMSNSELAERIKAEASGSPLLIDKMRLEKQLQKLRRIARGQELANQQRVDNITTYGMYIENSKKRIPNIEKDIQEVENNKVIIGGNIVESRKEIGEALYDEVTVLKESRAINPKEIGSIGAIKIEIQYSLTTDGVKVIFRSQHPNELEYTYTGQSIEGLGTKFVNRVDFYRSELQYNTLRIEEYTDKLDSLKKSKAGSFDKYEELEALEKELIAVKKGISDAANPDKKPAAKEEEAKVEEEKAPTDSYMKSPTLEDKKAFKQFWGIDHTAKAGKGLDAINYLLQKKNGHVVAAFNHKDIGDIDLVWGDNKAGLNHIIEQRTAQWGEEKALRFISHLAEIINDGVVFKDPKYPTRIELVNPKSSAVIELTYNSLDKNWLMSAYVNSGNKKKLQSHTIYGETLESEPTASVSENGAFSSLGVTDKSIPQIIPNIQTKEDSINQHYARVQGYDDAGVNFVPTYSVIGLPARSSDGFITIGNDRVALPSIQKPMNADTLRVYVSDIIGSRLYDGKIKGNKNVGVYKHKDSSIRLKSFSDMETLSHEMAHYLDYFHKNSNKNAAGSFFRKAILNNKEEVKSLSYTTNPDDVISEGFAEFVRLYLTNYNTVAQLAPNMMKDFEARLNDDQELAKKMVTLRNGLHQYFYQGATTRNYQGGELNPTAQKIQRSQAQIGKDYRQKLIDRIHSIKRIEAEIRGDNAVDAMNSPYKALQLVNGHSSIMHTAMNFGVPTVAANGDISYSGKSLNDIFAPATSVSEERVRLLSDYLVARRANELREQGRENLIPQEAIDNDLKYAQQYPEFETIAKEYQEFNTSMLDFYVGMNHITEAQRESFLEFNQNYVPFHRVMDSVQNGKTVQASTIGKRLTGGTHSLGNIMENIIDGLESNIKEALISRGKSMFYEMLDRSDMGGVYATKVPTESKAFKADLFEQASAVARTMQSLGLSVSKDGMIYEGSLKQNEVFDAEEIAQILMDRPELLTFFSHGHPPVAGSDSYIDSAIINGVRVYFETKDAGLIEAMTSFKGQSYGMAMNALMSVKNVMTWNITNNPLFYLTNFARDTVSASVLSKNKFIPVLTSMKGMYHFVTQSKVYKDFMASGAGYGTMRTTSGRDIQSMRMLNVNRGFDVFNKIISGMGKAADMFEYGTRIGDFELSQKDGKSNWQSAFEAREISTDFAIKGANSNLTGWMATVPFMKAAVNGIDKTARRIFSINGEMKLSNMAKFHDAQGELIKHKVKLYTAGGIIMTATLALWFQNKDDERYKKLTRDQKLMYWNIFVGDKHIKIPRPYDIGFAFAALPEIIADGIYSKHGEDAAMDFLWGIKSMFLIGDISGLFKPMADHAMNTNWMGSPIIPSNMQNMDDKGDQYNERTALIYKNAGKATGISPIMMQHYVDGYLGLTAKMIEEITENILWNTKAWGDRPFSQNPVEFLTYRFAGKKEDSRTAWSEKYYELSNKAKGVKTSYDMKYKKSFFDSGKDVMKYASEKETQAYLAIDKQTSDINSKLADMKVQLEQVTYSNKHTKEQKEQIINDAYKAKRVALEKVVTKLEQNIKALEGGE